MDPTEQPKLYVHGDITVSDEQVENYTSQINSHNLNLSNTTGLNDCSSNTAIQSCNTSSNNTSSCSSAPHYSKDVQHESSSSKINICRTIKSDEVNNISSPESDNQFNPYETETELHYYNVCGEKSSFSTHSNVSSTQKLNNSGTGPSKEEKQRQNEEIVCMVTSAISNETGSWELVLPYNATDLSIPDDSILNKDLLVGEPLTNRKDNVEMGQSLSACSTSGTSTSGAVLKDISSSSSFQKAHLSTSGNSACFIDASSLRDEEELISYVNLDNNNIIETHSLQSFQEIVKVEDTKSPTKQLEEFHKSFARCKGKKSVSTGTVAVDLLQKSHQARSTTSSNSGEESPQKPDLDSTNNLSDEEKIWKREQTNSELKNSSSLPELIDLGYHQSIHTATQQDATEDYVSVKDDVDLRHSLICSKSQHEQRQIKLPVNCQENRLQCSMQPLGDRPKFISSHSSSSLQGSIKGGTCIHNDLSNTTDYSSSSPAPSLVWSDHEPRTSLAAGLKRQQHKDCFKSSKILPDTPHNSIIYVEPLLINSNSNHRCFSISSSLSHHRDSGAYCSDAAESPTPMPRTPKRSKFDEVNPIISGGASIEDYNTKCESPSVKRKTDSCPIVSGGFVQEVQLHAKSKMRKHVPNIASWTVDMSDCGSERRKSTDSISNMDTVSIKCEDRLSSTSSYKSGCGFYVSLDDEDRKPQEKLLSKNTPKSTGFFVNLSQSDYREKVIDVSTSDKADLFANNNNLFNMFIDIGVKTQKVINKNQSGNLDQDLSNSLILTSNQTNDAGKSSTSSSETLKVKNNNLKPLLERECLTVGCNREGNTMDDICNIEKPITLAANRRIWMQSRNHTDSSKRHSWEASYNSMESTTVAGDYKRSNSLTACNYVKENINGNSGLMNIIDKLPIISKTSSLSNDSSLSPLDEFTGSKSGVSTCSNSSAINTCFIERDCESNGHVSETTRIKKRRCDVKINETFDKSSIASITDDLPSKDLSPESISDTIDMTFQQNDDLKMAQLQPLPLNNNANRSTTIMMETIIEAKETSSPNKNSTQKNGHTMETLHATIEKQKMLLETVNEVSEIGRSTYVKLSDMDKPINPDLTSPDSMSKSLGFHRQINRVYRDDSRARPHSWSMTHSSGNRLFNITNSVDNLRSLSRLFPNLSKEFSNSLPNDIVLHEMDYIQTDISLDTSLASSFSRSAMEESSISCRQPRRLGEDLLKMFLQEIATDMIVEVHGRRIKAHKCILRSRCQYFAAMLAGNGSQSIVTLQGYSYSAVHFALCHIYSGASHPPDGISLMELAALADLLGLEGLKEVTSYALKTNYCHNFHKPCSGCIDGILQVLPVALNHALDDLYRKCLRWTCRHYLKVWPTRQFAQLSQDILGRCRQQIVAYLTFETVLDVVLDCEHLLRQLFTYRWGNSCEDLVRDIRDAACCYIADHFASLIASDSFLSLGHDRSGQIPCLESLLLRTAASLTPDQACRSYQRITRLNTVLQAKVLQMPSNLGELAKELQGLQEEDLDWDPEYIRLVSELLSAVEQCLIRQCSPAMRVTAWQRMDLSLRKKIQTLSRLTEPLDVKRSCKTVSKASSFGGSTRNQDLFQIKMAIHAYSKRASTRDAGIYKATQPDDEGKSLQIDERGRVVHASKDLRECKILKSNSRAQIPQLRSISQTNIGSERNDVNENTMDRRNQFEIPPPRTTHKSVKKSASELKPAAMKQKLATRLSDVRPRYLQPRKTHDKSVVGPIRSATTSSVPVTYKSKVLHISSSDSSPYSSPANAFRSVNRNATRIVTKKANISIDSLTSRARRAKSAPQGKFLNSQRYSDITVDSLAESMKSSSITNKTNSNESLASTTNKRINSNQLSYSKTYTTATQAKPHMANSTVIKNTSNGQLQQTQINSKGSSASSVQTSKSTTSRLSSVGSIRTSKTVSNHGMTSTPTNSGNSQDKKYSFLSAKSRKILAKRAEKNKLQQQQDNLMQQIINTDKLRTNFQTQNLLSQQRSAPHSTIIQSDCQKNIRNSTRSHIPTRRPNTLFITKSSNGTIWHKVPTATVNAKKSHVSNENIVNYGLSTVTQECDVLINATIKELDIKSKLERSSTFCKEHTDLSPDINDTQDVIRKENGIIPR